MPISQTLLKTKEVLEDTDEFVLDLTIEAVLKECIVSTPSDRDAHSSQQQSQQREKNSINVQSTKHKNNLNFVEVRQK